jgi:restriction system protein
LPIKSSTAPTAPGQVLLYRRSVKRLHISIALAAMSEALRNATGSIGTVSNITDHHQDIEQFLSTLPGQAAPNIVATDPVVEDPVAFAMEKHLEDFLVKNRAGPCGGHRPKHPPDY